MPLLALLVAALLAAAPARAQVDEGNDALARAEFARAIAAFDAAERGPIDRVEYLSLLEGRALAAWASGDTERARADLAALAALDPGHRFRSEAPPEVTERFAETVAAREGPIAADARFTPDALTVRVQNDDAGLVANVRAHVRADGPWSIREGEPPALRVPMPANDRSEAWVELVGPGGAVLVTAGSEARPIVRERAAATEAPGDDAPLFIGLGVGGAVAVIAVIIAVAFVASSGETAGGVRPNAPVVVGF